MNYEEYFNLHKETFTEEWNNLSDFDKTIYNVDDIASYNYDMYIEQVIDPEDCPY